MANIKIDWEDLPTVVQLRLSKDLGEILQEEFLKEVNKEVIQKINEIAKT